MTAIISGEEIQGHLRAAIPPLAQHLRPGPPKAIDGLVIIGNDEHIVMGTENVD